MTARAFPSLRLLDHPVVQDRLTRLRDGSTPRRDFHRFLDELMTVAAAEVTRDLRLEPVTVEGPHGPARGGLLTEPVLLVPILRSGLGALGPLVRLLPQARVGHLGLRRDPVTRAPIEYLCRLPPYEGGPVIVVDPMIATGQTAAHALDLLTARGVPPERTRFLALLAAPEGLTVLTERHPDVPVFAAALDSHLDARQEIVPGLGDMGDRLFGTE